MPFSTVGDVGSTYNDRNVRQKQTTINAQRQTGGQEEIERNNKEEKNRKAGLRAWY